MTRICEELTVRKTGIRSRTTRSFTCLVRPVYLKRTKVNIIETVVLGTIGRLLPTPTTSTPIQSRPPRLSGDKKLEGATVFPSNTTLNQFKARRAKMFRSKLFGLVLPVLMIVTVLASTGFAQTKRYMRWVGYGISDGYHVATPGPNSDYYNPYTKHNSALWIQANEPAPKQMTAPRSSVSSFSKYPKFSSPNRRLSKRQAASASQTIRESANSFQPVPNKINTPARFKPSAPANPPQALPKKISTLKSQRSPQTATPISIARSLPSPNSNSTHLESVVIAGGIK